VFKKGKLAMFKSTIVLSFLILMGCAVALVPESNNPKTKIDQASILFNKQGRPVGAVRLLKQAIELAKEQKDLESEAIAEFYLGEIYKAPGPRGSKIKNPQLALEYYDRSIRIFDSLKYYKKSAFVYWNKSGAYNLLGKAKEQCQALRKAEKSHKKPGADAKDILSPEFASGNLLKSIHYLLKENKCK
ncbi:MAG: tetratricopeptide repeat protein, partial [Bdellovibrionales bacterium]|nr:tetratricopeptide repeat protein [Bdellovibrionales bacterium]